MKEPKKQSECIAGDIAVRMCIKRTTLSKSFIGYMYKTNCISGNTVYYAGGWSMRGDEWRPATKEETLAFHKGCKHIEDVVKYIKKEDYAIY